MHLLLCMMGHTKYNSPPRLWLLRSIFVTESPSSPMLEGSVNPAFPFNSMVRFSTNFQRNPGRQGRTEKRTSPSSFSASRALRETKPRSKRPASPRDRRAAEPHPQSRCIMYHALRMEMYRKGDEFASWGHRHIWRCILLDFFFNKVTDPKFHNETRSTNCFYPRSRD